MIARRALAAIAVLLSSAAFAGTKPPKIGEPAPAFEAVDTKGKKQKLSDYKGRFVVLEWKNHGCPYVKKHYESGNMQALQKRYTARGVVWLSVISSAPGTQGYSTPAEADKDVASRKASPTAVLLDENGTLGHLYDATNTPDMYVVDPKGKLIYAGAIDDIRSADMEDVAKAKNYVAAALDASMAGKPVETASTKPYGCGVKYK
ncbi:MAG: thioredoxin family protein [Proteobacteria bacterium]|nr:thioredoxin family protein [Pseudomonadota bacterium]